MNQGRFQRLFLLKTFSFLTCLLISYKSFAGSSLCIQTFNAFGPLYATDTKDRFTAFLKELNHEKCDIIQLQEVWTEKQISWVEKAMKSVYNLFAPNEKLRIGIMTLSEAKIDPVLVQRFRLNNSGDIFDDIREIANIRKAFSVAKTTIGNSGEEVYILNTHLHPMSTPIRLSQLLEIYDWRIKNPSLKLIVNGDFNSDPNSIEIRFIRDVMGLQDSYLSLKGSYPDNYCTYCTDNPRSFAKKNHIFDYIFYSSVSANFPNTKLYPIYYERNLTGSEKWSYSDHYGVLARFYLENMVPGQETKIPLQDSNVIIKTLEEVETILSNEHKSMYNQDIAYVENLKKTLTKE